MPSPFGPPRAPDLSSPLPSGPGAFDSGLDQLAIERTLAERWRPSRWIGWRLRVLVLAALPGCAVLFLIAYTLAALPRIDADWRVDARGRIEIAPSRTSALAPHAGAVLVALHGPAGARMSADPLLLQHSPRWISDDGDRDRSVAQHTTLSRWLSQGSLQLGFADGTVVPVQAEQRGFGHLGAMFWLLSAVALGLYLVAMAVLLARPSAPNALYALAALCQAVNVGFIAAESAFDLVLPGAFAATNAPLRSALDLASGAAIVHAVALHPRRLDRALPIVVAAWLSALVVTPLVVSGRLEGAWWWTQGLGTVLGLTTIALAHRSYRIEPHPFAMVMQRFAAVTVGGWMLLTVAIASSSARSVAQYHVAMVGPVIWAVFLAGLLLVAPFLSRSQQVLREFSLLAGVSALATSLDLVFIAVLSLGQFASLALSLFIALGAYIGAREWLVNQMRGSGTVTAERMFEQLYRIARDVEADPEQLPSRLVRLLRELFEPLETVPLERGVSASRILADGSTLVVPVPALGLPQAADAPRSIALRFAQRGRRLFTREDARLTDRVVEQLARAVAHDRAVEQGRSEERTRLAQDLHDDIGARLLTLMYKAQSPEMEDYVRHTLQDLKTLTRGLAASSHRLSHAAAEWKADITQRLSAANCELGWSATFDRDIVLNVVQWSALTRVLRELISNAIAHAQATRVDVAISLEFDRLDLRVADNGIGRDPGGWAHGLGLGGVRKRVKQLGGDVEWRENLERGISCRVRIRELR